jgi:RNA polymerase sigma-70 factor (ECF subfamily)
VEQENMSDRLSQIPTLWTLVLRGVGGSGAAEVGAQRALLERYGKAVHRYLLACVRNADTADELFQEFALRLLNGNLRRANPDRGRFRDFVKGVLFHLVEKHRRRETQHPRQLPAHFPDPASEPPSFSDLDREFLVRWREGLLARTWEALAEVERQSGQLFCTVLSLRRDYPDLHSPDLARLLSTKVGRPFTAPGFRKALERARKKFDQLLCQEVVQTLADPTMDELLDELEELGLLRYCRPAFGGTEAK